MHPPGANSALCPTASAALRLVTEFLGMVEDLFTGGEHEFFPTIDARQSRVNEFHNRLLLSRGMAAHSGEGLENWVDQLHGQTLRINCRSSANLSAISLLRW